MSDRYSAWKTETAIAFLQNPTKWEGLFYDTNKGRHIAKNFILGASFVTCQICSE